MSPLLIGLAGPIVVLMIAAVGSRGKIFNVWEGADGRASTSKFQFFLWTLVVSYGYIAVVAKRGDFQPLQQFPQHLLIAMGFSATTMAAAKGITTVYTASNGLSKPSLSVGGSALTREDGRAIQKQLASPAKPQRLALWAQQWGGLVQDDTGFPDLSKIQLVFWTLLALVIFIAATWKSVSSSNAQLSDIDPSLMVLMGLGQAAYLGKKLVTVDSPRLTGLTSTKVLLGSTATLGITGGGLGSGADSQVNFNGQLLPCEIVTWTDKQISLRNINAPADQAPPLHGQLTLVVGGAESNGLDLDLVSAPLLTGISKARVSLSADPSLVVRGRGLGSTPAEIDFKGNPLPNISTKWTETEIGLKVTIPPEQAPGQGKLRVVVDSLQSNEIDVALAP